MTFIFLITAFSKGGAAYTATRD